eukprot:scaffold327010_cov58-Tisochrysis_lutea.AAC.1
MHERGPWKKIISAMESSLPSLAQGGRVLDLGTGPGEPANMIARGMPAVSVCATDPSDDMLNKARARMSGLPNVQFAQVDAQDLSRYEDESFDAVTACYVYMFPEDKERALRETYRVLKPGGKLFATYWTELAMMSLLRDTMTGVLGFTPPPPAINPLVLAPDDLFDGMLKDAGFAQTEFSVGAYPCATRRMLRNRTTGVTAIEFIAELIDAGRKSLLSTAHPPRGACAGQLVIDRVVCLPPCTVCARHDASEGEAG